jgi:hypothetical protein
VYDPTVSSARAAGKEKTAQLAPLGICAVHEISHCFSKRFAVA